MDEERFLKFIRMIYEASSGLEEMFPGRHFTPDGHMIGSIGEAIAATYYGIKLLPASAKGHDGIVVDRKVQVKATQRERIAISSEPKYLLVLRLTGDADLFEEVYNGPGGPVWTLVCSKPLPKNGQYQVGLAKLRELNRSVDAAERIERV